MPGRDKSGPEGKGPMTGRQLGTCKGSEPIGRGFGRGQRAGLGRGFGMGFGRGFRRSIGRGFNRLNNDSFQDPSDSEPVELTKEQKQKILENELKKLELEKKDIENRLKELK